MKSRRSDSLSIFLSFTLRKTTTMAENDFEVVKRQLEVINPHQRGLPGAPEVEEAADVAPRAVPPTVAVPADGDDVAADADDNDAAASVSAASSEGRAAEMILNPEADENLECQNELWLWQEHTRQQQARQKGAAGGRPAEPGEQPLVDKLSELKMIRSLQMRVNTRTKRFSQLLTEGTEQADEPELLDAVRRLSDRQRKIERAAHGIVSGLTE